MLVDEDATYTDIDELICTVLGIDASSVVVGRVGRPGCMVHCMFRMLGRQHRGLPILLNGA